MTIRSFTRRAATVTVVAATAVLCAGAAAPGSATTGAPPVPDAATAATVRALSAGDVDAALAHFPAGFEDAMGYRPVMEPGAGGGAALADPLGDCSSPVPLPASFESACRVHDLGYDLLRYARDAGGELGGGARRGFDDQLARNLHAICATEPASTSCRVTADVAVAAVRINSWRQGHRMPESESPWPFVGATAALAALGATARRARR